MGRDLYLGAKGETAVKLTPGDVATILVALDLHRTEMAESGLTRYVRRDERVATKIEGARRWA
jgi:hypothetical protein